MPPKRRPERLGAKTNEMPRKRRPETRDKAAKHPAMNRVMDALGHNRHAYAIATMQGLPRKARC
jgi:hypothetical protein